MLILPAVDIRKGRCVRLLQGKASEETVYAEDPVAQALEWERRGARYLHIVDLDGAFSGRVVHGEIVRRMAERLTVPFEFGGGVRTLGDVERLLEVGVDRVVLGTGTVEKEDFALSAARRFGRRVAVSVDASGGKVAVRGWEETTALEARDFARTMEDAGIEMLIYTDISRDGALTGPNFKGVEEILDAVAVPVIASGGIATLEQAERLRSMEEKGICGMIVGRALYTGALRLEDLL